MVSIHKSILSVDELLSNAFALDVQVAIDCSARLRTVPFPQSVEDQKCNSLQRCRTYSIDAQQSKSQQ